MKNLVTTYFFEQKNVRGYFIAFLLAAILLGCLSILSFNSGALFLLMKTLQLLAFIFLGLLHTAATERGLQFLEDTFQRRLSFTALLTVLIFISLLIIYIFVNGNILVMAFASSCAFLLPFMLIQLWGMFIKPPESDLMTWYGFRDLPDSSDTVYLSSIPVTFALTTSYTDREIIPFSVKAPLHMELSKVFNLFVVAAKENYNIDIESTDESNRPYGWQFYTASLNGLLNVRFDPETSIGDNREIKPDTIIFAKRIKPTGAYHISPQRKMDLTIN